MVSTAPTNDMPLSGARRFPPLEQEVRAAVDTECAAFHLSRRPQTLRAWACLGGGPIRPIRVNGRLAWPVAQLRRVLGVA
jgi:hypothetical protein